MEDKGRSVANRLLELKLNPVPVVKGSKVPTRKCHTELITKEEIKKYDFSELGISTGYSSLNLEVLDFDLKNTEEPEDYMNRYKQLIPKELFKKLVIQSTPSGGYHYLYRCPIIEANQKLARNKKGAAVIETRGIGGYIKSYPSEGYEMIQNTFADIKVLDESERNLLINLAKQKDKLASRDIHKRYSSEDKKQFKVFPDYNENSDVGIGLLEDNGWVFHSENGDWYNLTRPNSKSGDLHGGYNRADFFFQTFSTGQDTFEGGRGYNNHHLFAELECGGNYPQAYAKLHERGLGVGGGEGDEDDSDINFLSDEIDEDIYLEQARKGEIPLGYSLGWRDLDSNWRLKKNSFIFILGLDNIGKSTLLSTLMVSTKVQYGYKWGISSPESNNSVTRRNLIEAESGRLIKSFKDSPTLYHKYLTESRKHFHIIQNKEHWTIDQILEKGKILFEKYGIDFLLIDPFSFYSGSGNFSDDTDILSKIRVFCENYCSVLVIDHPFTGFTRVGKDEHGYLRMPTKYEIAGGNSKANRCDDFISTHRIVNHTDNEVRKTMMVSVQKVKDKSTGGEPHTEGEYTQLIYEERDGFLGYWDTNGDNPLYAAIKSRQGVRAQMKGITPAEAFGEPEEGEKGEEYFDRPF